MLAQHHLRQAKRGPRSPPTKRAGATVVVLDLYSGGAHCCSIEQVYSFGATSTKVTKIERNSVTRALEDGFNLGPSGLTYFVSRQRPLRLRLHGLAASGLPIQILTFSHQRYIS